MAEPARDLTPDSRLPANASSPSQPQAPDNVIQFPGTSPQVNDGSPVLPTQDPQYVMRSVARAQRSPLPDIPPANNNDNYSSPSPAGSDPSYNLRAHQFAAQSSDGPQLRSPEASVAGAVSASAAEAIETAEELGGLSLEYAWLTWMWGSIPAVFADLGLNFFLASCASFISLLRSLLGERFISLFTGFLSIIPIPSAQKYAASGAIPPAFWGFPGVEVPGNQKMLRVLIGLGTFAFFLTASLFWILVFAVIIPSLFVIIYVMVAPYVETISFVCQFIDISPACLVAPS